jgi:hypothetical protein
MDLGQGFGVVQSRFSLVAGDVLSEKTGKPPVKAPPASR